MELAVVEPGLRGQIIEIGGPEDVTLNEMADRFEVVTGKRGARAHAPVPVMRLMSTALRPFKPVLAGMIGAGVVMDTRDMRADTAETRHRYPSIPTTDLDEMMRRDYLPS